MDFSGIAQVAGVRWQASAVLACVVVVPDAAIVRAAAFVAAPSAVREMFADPGGLADASVLELLASVEAEARHRASLTTRHRTEKPDPVPGADRASSGTRPTAVPEIASNTGSG